MSIPNQGRIHWDVKFPELLIQSHYQQRLQEYPKFLDTLSYNTVLFHCHFKSLSDSLEFTFLVTCLSASNVETFRDDPMSLLPNLPFHRRYFVMSHVNQLKKNHLSFYY